MNIAFAGTPEFAATILQGLLSHDYRPCVVLTQPDRPSGRGRKLVPSAVKTVATQAGLPIQQPASLRPTKANGRNALAALQQIPMDLLIVAAYGLILPKAALEHPKHGAVNVHASILPRWRGAAPIERAIMAGDSTSGATLMQMDEGLDTGDIIAFSTCDISGQRTAADITGEIAQLGIALLLEALPNLAALKRIPQDEVQATYAPKLAATEALIDWQESAQTIHDQVRALSGRMTAYSWITGADGQPLRLGILSSKVLRKEEIPQLSQPSPGELLPCDKKQLHVACGTGALSVVSLQLNTGKGKVMDAASAKNGYAELFHPGFKLG